MFLFLAPAAAALAIVLLSAPLALAQSPPAAAAAADATSSAPQAAQPRQAPLTFEQALQLAEQRSQALPAQALAAQAARERAVAAGQRPDPVLRFGLENTPVQGPNYQRLTREPMSRRTIGIVQALPDAAKRGARASRFEQEAMLVNARRHAQRGELRMATALAWLAVQAETQRLSVLTAQRREAELLSQAAEAAYSAGRGAQADVFMARALPIRIDDQRLLAQARLDSARSGLQRWLGADADRTLATMPPLDSHPLGGDVTDALAQQDPVVLVALARENTARAAADVAREERRADWSVDLLYAQRGPRFDNQVTLGFSTPWRLDTANRQDRETSARLAEAAQIEADTEELRRVRLAEVQTWQHRWRAGRLRLAGLDDGLAPLARSRTAAALGAYRAGSGTLQAVLDARQAELGLALERVQIELDTASDWARLSTLIPPTEIQP
jgi:cobalt-zinc-cadmium efflux system outer membrane protein